MTDETTGATTALLKKTKAKSKGKTAPDVAEEQAPDLIVSTSHELENLSRDEAYALVPELTNNVDFTYFRLGGLLAVMQGNSNWWKEDGFDTFRAFIEERFGINYRKAMYLISIYGSLVESGVAWEKLAGIGWSKVKEIADILTVDNVDEWVERAKELTVLQLQDAVRKAKIGTLDKPDEQTGGDGGSTTFTCKVFPDQKETIQNAIDKAMKEAGTDSKGVALEAVCMNYLSGAKVQKPKSLEQIMKGYRKEDGGGYEEVLQAITKVWPDIDLTVSV